MRHLAMIVIASLSITACASHAPTSVPNAQPSLEPNAGPAAEPKVEKRSTTMSTRRENVVERLFGVEVADPYRWLAEGASAEVKEWMGAQHRAAEEQLRTHPEREVIEQRLRALHYVDTISPPIRRRNRWFWEKKSGDR